MPAPKPARVVDSLGLLESIESGLAARPGVDPKVKAVLAANAAQVSLFAQRLSMPTAREWREFVTHVEEHPAHDVYRFLFGDDVGYEINNVTFLRAMRDTVLAFAEFQGDGA